jgi:hypothetical protein
MTENRGGPALTQMNRQVQTLERSSASAGGMLARLGAGVGAYLGFQQGRKHLIDFNSQMEQSKIQMAGLMEQAGRGDFVSNMESASKLVKQMQLDARASVGTTQDFVQMASMLVQPLTMAGASMEGLRDMTRQSVIASRAMGIASDVAARDIDQAVRGMYRSVDQFSGKLLTPRGFGGEEGRKKFNAMTMQQRLAEMQRALGSSAIASMAKAQEASFDGVTSTLVDNIQMTMGKVGLPLFKKVTEEVKRWNDWLDKNQKNVEHIADVVGNKLVQAAVSFGNAIGFAAEHWKSIALSYGALKAAGFLAATSGTAGGIGGAGGIGASAKMAAAGLVISVAYVGALEVANFIDKSQSRSLEAKGRFDMSTVDLLAQAKGGPSGKSARALLGMARMQGWGDDKGNVNEGSILAGIREMGMDQRKSLAGTLGMQWNAANTYAEPLAREAAKQFAIYLREAMGATPEELMSRGQPGAVLPKAEKPKVTVHINRIEVASEDPDRFAFRMVNALRGAVKNPGGIGSALHALREG